MNYYQQYDTCFSISFCASGNLEFWVGSLEHCNGSFGYGFWYKKSYGYVPRRSISTILNQQLSEITKLWDLPGRDMFTDCVETAIITRRINKLYHKIQQQHNILNDPIFLAIADDIKTWLNEMCNVLQVDLANMYLIFIIPNEWNENSDIIERIFEPILAGAGAALPQDRFHRALYITQLEAQLSNLQLEEDNKNSRPSFFQNENRCLIYDIVIQDSKLTLHPKYFQLKEDYNLRLFNENYYLPKLLQYSNTSSYFHDKSIDDIERELMQLITDNFVASRGSNKNTSGLFDILENKFQPFFEEITTLITSNAHSEHGSDIDKYNQTTLRLVEEYINQSHHPGTAESAATLLSNFTKGFESLFLRMICAPIADYIKEETRKVPHFRKHIILNGHNIGMLRRSNSQIYRILFQFLQQEVVHHYPEANWYFLTTKNPDESEDTVAGAFLKAAREAMISNIITEPDVLLEHEQTNKIGLPCQYPTDTIIKCSAAPEIIVYIDISLESSIIEYVSVDQCGLVQEENDIHLSNFDKSCLLDDLLNESKEKISSTSRQTLANRSKLIDFINKFSWKNLKRGRPLFTEPVKLCLLDYLKRLIDGIDTHFRHQDVQPEKIVYALCLDKLLMEKFGLKSRLDTLQLIKESNNIVDFDTNPREMIIIDQGEKIVWSLFQKSALEPLSYYVHSHMTDTYIHLKLLQVIDTTKYSGIQKESTPILIKEKTFSMKNVYEQVSETLWCHMVSVDDVKAFKGSFKTFNKEIIRFIKEKLFANDQNQNYIDFFDINQKIELPESGKIVFTIRQLLDSAIIPVLERALSMIISSLVDFDMFGYYQIAKVFLTGSFLKIKEHNDTYQHLITTEAKRILRRLMKETTDRTKFEISIKTYSQSLPRLQPISCINQKPCGFDRFVKGELRTVSNSTHFIGNIRYRDDKKLDNFMFSIENAITCGHSCSITIRGEEFKEGRSLVKISRSNDTNQDCSNTLGFYKFYEPCDRRKIEGGNFLEIGSTKYKIAGKFTPNRLNLITVQVKQLQYLSCIQIICEHHRVHEDGKIGTETESYLLGEIQSLKYF